MAIPTIDPARPDLIASLAGYLGEHSIINAKIKGQKGIAKVYIYIEPFSDPDGTNIRVSKWSFAQAADPRSVVGLMWSFPPDDPEAGPEPAHWIEYQSGEVYREVDETGHGNTYERGRNIWWDWNRGPVWLEDRAFGWVDPEALDLDWSDVIAFLKQKGIRLPKQG